jgi:transcriptional regulator with XRE-family HTH domain
MGILKKKKAWQRMAADKKYREEYAIAMLKRMIPYQTRAIRQKKNWSQAQLAEAANLTQGVISRAEDPDYGNLTLSTIGRIAAGYDLAAIVRFVPFSELVRFSENLSEREFRNLPAFEEENASTHVEEGSRGPAEQGRVFVNMSASASGAMHSSVAMLPSVVQPGPVQTRVRRESRRRRGPSLTVSEAEQTTQRSNPNDGRASTNDDQNFAFLASTYSGGQPSQSGV